jgi:hypothetical protein
MRQIFLLIAESFMQQFLRAPDQGHTNGIGPALLEPAKEYVAETVKKYAVTVAVAFVFTLYFVAGTLIMTTAAASSFDAFGFFSPGTFFYSGVAITIISAAVLGGCYASVKKGSKLKAKEPIVEIQPVRKESEFHVGQLGPIAEAVITGIISGLVSRRIAKRSAPVPSSFRDRLRQVI